MHMILASKTTIDVTVVVRQRSSDRVGTCKAQTIFSATFDLNKALNPIWNLCSILFILKIGNISSNSGELVRFGLRHFPLSVSHPTAEMVPISKGCVIMNSFLSTYLLCWSTVICDRQLVRVRSISASRRSSSISSPSAISIEVKLALIAPSKSNSSV